MRARGLLPALALLAWGCTARSPAPEAPGPAGFVIVCDRARVVVPAGESVRFDAAGEYTRGEVTVRTAAPSVEVGGEDFSVVAEGNVLILRRAGPRTWEEGPYGLVILRNGNLLRR